MKQILSIFLICLCVACSTTKNNNSQKPIYAIEGAPILTYEQLLEDHDSLVSYINQVSPIVYFNEEVRGIDFNRHAIELRKQIQPQTTISEYLQIVEKTLNSAQDGHSNMLGSWHLDILKNNWIPNGFVKGIDTSSIQYGYKYVDYLNKQFYTKLNLDLVYTSGQYYNLLPFSYAGKTYPASMKLISCNGTDIHDYVKTRIEHSSPLRWDRANDRAYHEKFYKPSDNYKKGLLKLVFLDKDNKKHKLHIKKNDTVTFLQDKNSVYGYNNEKSPIITHYFEKEKIFYAKLPMMVEAYGDTLSERLKPIISKNKVNAIVLDIRGNPGGSDNTYSNFLKKVVKDTLGQNVMVGRNFSPYNQNYFNINKDSVENRTTHTFKIDAATLKKPKMYYIVYPNFKFVVPDSLNYSFEGKIYVLQDRFIYSSASNLSNLAKNNDQLISIGETPDLLGGLQTNPTVLQLPHSKIIFRIESQIDFTDCKTPKDIFQNNVEYPVSYSIKELYSRITTKEDIFGKPFLLNSDPMFQKAVELEKLRKQDQ
ncbi:hypothetical protein ABH942_000476 [Flavobacterium sp. 28YEA47A]|uniref:S41 family peptidase n=1 Tax=Flavobacterium sp. 28YEA47A TaxID=3156276 RepID=UPI003514C19B